MTQVITCINCPVGCRMTVLLSDDGEFLSVTGNTCPRGASYARQECTLPKRVITAVIPVEGSRTPLSVKTSCPIPKAMIYQIMGKLSTLHLQTPVTSGQVIVRDILQTGADIIATCSIP